MNNQDSKVVEKCAHTEHCCSEHGCKYGGVQCPVALHIKKQSFACEDCKLPQEPEAYMPKVGEELDGVKAFSSEGPESWFNGPRFVVVGHHSNGLRFFVETLGVKDSGIQVFSAGSDQYRPIKTEREKVIEFATKTNHALKYQASEKEMFEALYDAGALTMPESKK